MCPRTSRRGASSNVGEGRGELGPGVVEPCRRARSRRTAKRRPRARALRRRASPTLDTELARSAGQRWK